MTGKIVLTQDEFSELIGRIYDCAIDPSLWNDTLLRIQEKLKYVEAGMDLFDLETRHYLVAEQTHIEPGHALIKLEYARDIMDIYQRSAPFYYSWPMEKPFTASRHNWFENFGGNRYIQLTRSWGIIDMFHMILLRNANRFGTLTMGRHERDGPIGKEDYEALKLLIPHLRRALSISDLLNAQRLEIHALKSTMDSVEAAIIIVADDLSILYANSSAESALRSGTAILSRFGKLAAQNGVADKLLEQSVAAAACQHLPESNKVGVPLPGIEDDSIAFVLPLARSETRLRFTPRAKAAIFIASRSSQKVVPIKVVAALYQLTPAETKVLEQLAAGKTPGEAADALNLSLATVRTHLARLFSKTDTSRQSELIALLAKFAPPV